MKLVKNLFLVAMGVGLLTSCNSDDDANTSRVKVAVKKTEAIAKSGGTTTNTVNVELKTLKLSIGEIEFDITKELEGQQTNDGSVFSDAELDGPFVVDLLDKNAETGIDLAVANIPNAKYEEIEFDIEPYIGEEHADMVGKTFIIEGTYGQKNFKIEGTEELELEVEYPNGYTLDGTDSNLFIDLQIGALKDKVTQIDLANAVPEEDGSILINKEKNTELLKQIETTLEDAFEVEDDDDDEKKEEEPKK